MTSIAVTRYCLWPFFNGRERNDMTKQHYSVRVLDNFNFMDESAEYNSGTFNTYEEAAAKCKSIIDDFLESAYTPGDTAEQLYNSFIMFGESPILSGPKLGEFSDAAYTRARCLEITTSEKPNLQKFIRSIDSK